MLFLFNWPDRPSFLVDAKSKAKAAALALEWAGVEPFKCFALPVGVFAAEVTADEQDEDTEAPIVEMDLAAALAPGFAAMLDDDGSVCFALGRAEDGADVRCVLEPSHGGEEHESAGGLVWPVTP